MFPLFPMPPLFLLLVVAVLWYLLATSAKPRPAPPRMTSPVSSRERIRSAIPASWPVRETLLALTSELAALRDTIQAAEAHGVPSSLLAQYRRHFAEVDALVQRNVARIAAVARPGGMPPGLDDALARQQRKLQRMLTALESARGGLAAAIVTGLDDQQELERAARSLDALGAALCEVAADAPTGPTPSVCHAAP